MLQIADGKLANPFEVAGANQGAGQADGKDGIFGGLKKMFGMQDKQEEEKKQEDFKDRMSRLKNVDPRL